MLNDKKFVPRKIFVEMELMFPPEHILSKISTVT